MERHKDAAGGTAWLWIALMMMGACAVSGQQGALQQEQDRAGFRPMDSLRFVTGGHPFDLVILKSVQEDSVLTDGARWAFVRPLLLYRVGAHGERTRVLRNDSLVLCDECGGVFGDPYEGISFERDTLKLRHYGGSAWRWASEHAFIHAVDGSWPLVGLTKVSYSVYEPDSTQEVSHALPDPPVDLRSCNAYR